MKRFIMMSMAIAAVVAVHAQSSVTSTLAKEAAKAAVSSAASKVTSSASSNASVSKALYCQRGQFCLQQG